VSSRQLYLRLIKEFRPMRDHVRHAGGGRVAAATDVLLLRQLQNVVDALTPAKRWA
jgi:subfamily B ATP-binding cassette protein MsbA